MRPVTCLPRKLLLLAFAGLLVAASNAHAAPPVAATTPNTSVVADVPRVFRSDIEAVSEQDLIQAVRVAIRDRYASGASLDSVTPVGAWGDLKGLLSRAHLARMASSSDGEIDHVTVTFESGNSSEGHAPTLKFTVHPTAIAWTAAVALHRGDPLNCQTLKPASHPKHATYWYGRCEDLSGATTRHPLLPGDVLRSTDLMPQATVHEQQEATVSAHVGAVAVEARGMVLADADVGQTVAVKIAGHASAVRAVVVAPGQLSTSGEAP